MGLNCFLGQSRSGSINVSIFNKIVLHCCNILACVDIQLNTGEGHTALYSVYTHKYIRLPAKV